jgi:hypothetical protein
VEVILEYSKFLGMNNSTSQPSKFWLYLGIILVCSGVGVGIGAVLLGLYFWSDIKNAILQSNKKPRTDEIWNILGQKSSKWFDSDTLEDMK